MTGVYKDPITRDAILLMVKKGQAWPSELGPLFGVSRRIVSMWIRDLKLRRVFVKARDLHLLEYKRAALKEAARGRRREEVDRKYIR